jgi:hypothetical protein
VPNGLFDWKHCNLWAVQYTNNFRPGKISDSKWARMLEGLTGVDPASDDGDNGYDAGDTSLLDLHRGDLVMSSSPNKFD